MAKRTPMPMCAVPMDLPKPQLRSEVKAAFDPKYDPSPNYYGDTQAEQAIRGGTSFADLREDMNARRRKTARRMSDRGDFY